VDFVGPPGPVKWTDLAVERFPNSATQRITQRANDGIIDAQAPFCHQLHRFAIGEAPAQVPAQEQDDDLASKGVRGTVPAKFA
jgi:hypothetical protein